MPAPIPYAHREEIIRRKEGGESLKAIARALGYSYTGVRQIWRRYRDRGMEGLKPDYPRGQGRLHRCEAVYRQALAWKQEHPRWGAGLVRSLLLQQWPEEKVPSERTLQRWWARAGLNRRPRGKSPSASLSRACEVHEVWQMDGGEEGRWSWLTVTDEYSGAILAGRLFPLSQGGGDSS